MYILPKKYICIYCRMGSSRSVCEMVSLVRPIPREAFKPLQTLFLYSPWSLHYGEVAMLSALTSFFHDDLMPTPKDLRDAAKEHATFSERMEKNLRKIAEIRDTAGLGSEGSPKGTDALDDETKLVYMEAIREHLCYKMSTAGLLRRN